MYLIELLGTFVFAMSGVIAVSRRGLDVVGAIMLGLVTAVGGAIIFIGRALAIFYHLEMPAWLVKQD